jgi:hypothetical protein
VSRRALLAQLTSSELTEWMAYMMIEEQDREAERDKASKKHRHKR